MDWLTQISVRVSTNEKGIVSHWFALIMELIENQASKYIIDKLINCDFDPSDKTSQYSELL